MAVKKRSNQVVSQNIFRSFLVILVVVLLILHLSSLHAEPYIAIREGYKCSKCHVNVTGGGKRTDYANIYVQTRLLQDFVNWKNPLEDSVKDEETAIVDTPTSSFFSGWLNDFIAVGGDFRQNFLYTETPNQSTQHEFNLTKSVIYLQVDLIPEKVLFYWTAPGGGDAREIFGLVKGYSSQFYLKAGQFFLPYGLRIHDDTAFIRSETGFTYKQTDVGLEIGLEPAFGSASLALTNGTGASGDTNTEKRITFSTSFIQRNYRLGVSFSENEKPDTSKTNTNNIFTGFHFGRFTILAQADAISNKSDSGDQTDQIAALAEIDFLIARGMNLKLSYDFLDPDQEIEENERERYSMVFEPFLVQFTQIRSGVRIYKGIPQDDESNRSEFFLELHLFM